MGDNVRAASNDASLPLIATDDVSGVQYQRVKLDVGADGATTPVVGSLPVQNVSLAGTVLATAVSVGVTAVALPSSPLSGRRTMLVQSDVSNSAYIYLGGSGVTAGATSTGGVILTTGQAMTLDVGAAVVYAIAGAAGQVVRVVEVA